jgi:putative ABC transport system permease protein
MRNLALFRIAARGFRGGLAGFGIFLACIALGVAAIVGVGSVSRGFSDGLAYQSRVILGGDASFSVEGRQLTSTELSWLSARGSVSAIATLRAMAERPDHSLTLVDLKAVDSHWPSEGAATVDPDRPLNQLLASQGGVDGMIADDALKARLGLSLGDRVTIGDQTFALRGVLVSEPDALAGGLALAPRVIITQAALRQTKLLQPGALVQWTYRVILKGPSNRSASEAAAIALVKAANAAFPKAGWETRTRQNVSPQFAQSIQQLSQFLTLVALTALIVGGVGVANAVRAFVERKIGELATLKSLGATGGVVFSFSLIQIMIMAGLGVVIGIVLGSSIPFILAPGLHRIAQIPFDPAFYWSECAKGAVYGLLTALTFSIPPLGRAHDVRVGALFRDRVEPAHGLPRMRYFVAVLIAAAGLLGAIVAFASDLRIVIIYLVICSVGFLLLRALAWSLMAAARRAPRLPSVELRLALGNISRPGALTPTILLSLGLALAVLVAIVCIQDSLRREIGQATPGETPSLFFLDVPGDQASSFRNFVEKHASKATLNEVPMMRGRIVRLNGVPAEDVKIDSQAAWVLEGDRGITYSSSPPSASLVTSGSWWPKNYAGTPLVSFDGEIARELHLKLGDTITVNVLGREVTAKIANLRAVNWRTMGINFVTIFSPNSFAGAPYTTLAAAIFPQSASPNADLNLLRDVADAYPMVTVIRVKDVLATFNQLLDRVALAIRCASAVALISAVLALASALASSQRTRLYDAVVLKLLGATRWRLTLSMLIEHSLLGLVAAVLGILIGELASYFILTQIMQVESAYWDWQPAVLSTFIALALSVALGLAFTIRALGQKPGPYLRAP